MKIRRIADLILTMLHRRGVGYLSHLGLGYGIPHLAYRIYRSPLQYRTRQLAIAAAALFTLVVALIIGLIFGVKAGIVAAAALILVGVGAVGLSRVATYSRLESHARQLDRDRGGRVSAASFTRWSTFPVSADTRSGIEGARQKPGTTEVVVGRIDDDGRVLGLFGELPGLPNIDKASFVERKRFDLSIVVIDDAVLIRKDYRGDRRSMVYEWATLLHLAGKVNVPAVHHIDDAGTLLYKNLIVGETLRERLVAAGAKILRTHTNNDPALAQLSELQRVEAAWQRAGEVLPKCFSEDFLRLMEQQLERAHAERVVGMSLTYGNVVFDAATQTPWFIDFDRARIEDSKCSVTFQFQRDREREQFNKLYARSLMTETSARADLADKAKKIPGWYAPIDFGGGLSVGQFWTTDSGTGRWEYLNGPMLGTLLSGKRILDLGSNNGIMPVMMLRSGAKEVFGVEISPDFAECAHLVRRIFEWRDQQHYDLKIHVGDMLDVLSKDWGNFDIVTAFCSLYYLEPEQMAAVVRKASQLAPMLILQAKTDTRSDAAENKSEKSALSFLKELMEKNGFPQVETIAPSGFSRPLLIGHRSSGVGSLSSESKQVAV